VEAQDKYCVDCLRNWDTSGTIRS